MTRSTIPALAVAGALLLGACGNQAADTATRDAVQQTVERFVQAVADPDVSRVESVEIVGNRATVQLSAPVRQGAAEVHLARVDGRWMIKGAD